VILSETHVMSISPLDKGAFDGSIGRGFMHRLTADGHLIYTESVEITLWRQQGHGLERVHLAGARSRLGGELSAIQKER
jgi:hypothetical protein